jgi:DNA-binding transcriptional regulator WhiA
MKNLYQMQINIGFKKNNYLKKNYKYFFYLINPWWLNNRQLH